MELSILLLGFVFGLQLLVYYAFRQKNKSLPGPLGFPILGHLPLLGQHPPRKFTEWAKTYGPIFQIRFGSFRTVVISDVKLLSEAFSVPSLSGRPFMITHTIPTERKGLVFSEYLDNKEQRQFVLRALKDSGIKGYAFNDAIHESVTQFVQSLKAQEGTGVQVVGLFNLSILNSVWNCIMSSKLPANDLSQVLLGASNRITAFGGLLAQLGVFIPWFGLLFPNLTEITSGTKAYKDLYTFLDEQIKRHRETWIKNKPRDFIDAYLDKIEETTDENSSFFARKNFIRSTVADLFTASSDTTSASLEFSMLYMAKYPNVQKRIQEEISKVVPILSEPSLHDRENMPYTEAVVNEILRFSTVVPMGIFHNATEDVTFHDYRIPKDTMLLSNLYGINHDPEIWQDPENFRPERFMKEDSQQKRKLLHTFSVGRRICPGDRIARDEIFMFITGILQKFDIKFTSVIPSLEGEFGFVRHPKPFEVTFSSRITSVDNKCAE
ncbi:unnamed protein product [Allacma fusca]|uniref:Cytochrome P450 n=1 Tax=Allacma fusca TaxID=39272 RepID=A0A8J2KBV3_9HEXA|nr:unnamed protein product [Allacma fusca]